MTTYVLQGILYFIAHPNLWLTSLCPILMTMVVALVSVIALFTIALYPQAYGLIHVGVPTSVAWLVAVILVILEIFLITMIYSLACLPCFADKIFRQVMKMRGFEELIENEAGHSSCGRVCASCCRISIIGRLAVAIITFPLNLVPIVGTVAYIWMNGFLLAWEYHLYYFELKGYSYVEQKAVIDQRKAQYSSFGMQAMALEMIPFFGSLFIFTNTVGAALFAADMEEEAKDSQSHWHTVATTEAGNAHAHQQAQQNMVTPKRSNPIPPVRDTPI